MTKPRRTLRRQPKPPGIDQREAGEHYYARLIEGMFTYLEASDEGGLPATFADCYATDAPTLDRMAAVAWGMARRDETPARLAGTFAWFMKSALPGVAIEFYRASPLTPRTARLFRGVGGLPRGDCVRVDRASVWDSGRAQKSLAYWFWSNPDRCWWSPGVEGTARRRPFVRYTGRRWSSGVDYALNVDSVIPDMANWLKAAAEHLWRVRLTFGGRASVVLPTDAGGVCGLFALRDRPAGRDRRQALAHWVREHWRQSRADPDAEHRVRAHLRGSPEFSWFGMAGRVQPPAGFVKE